VAHRAGFEPKIIIEKAGPREARPESTALWFDAESLRRHLEKRVYV